jgi:hypothetical protein
MFGVYDGMNLNVPLVDDGADHLDRMDMYFLIKL